MAIFHAPERGYSAFESRVVAIGCSMLTVPSSFRARQHKFVYEGVLTQSRMSNESSLSFGEGLRVHSHLVNYACFMVQLWSVYVTRGL